MGAGYGHKRDQGGAAGPALALGSALTGPPTARRTRGHAFRKGANQSGSNVTLAGVSHATVSR